MVGDFSGRISSGKQTGVAADLLFYLGLGFAAVAATEFFMLGAAAIVLTTAFFGFFSSRRRLVIPLAMIWFLLMRPSSLTARRPYLFSLRWPRLVIKQL